jgi:UDP-glucose 4-epimerase
MTGWQLSKGTKFVRVLLTGGAGYIGSHVALELIELGHEVAVVDDLSNSSSESIRRIQEMTGRKIDFHVGDITDERVVEKVFAASHIDAVVHLAGHKAVADSVARPLVYYRNNIGSTVVLLAAMARHNVAKLVFSSSATVYEQPTKLPIPESSRAGLNVANPYGRTKAMAERILMDVAGGDDRLEIAILRYFNPVGAHESGRIGEDPLETPNNLMPYVSQVALGRRERVFVYGDRYDTPDGTGVRDYVHVADLASGHAAALHHLKAGVDVYNLGTGRGSSVLQVIEEYADVTGRPIPFEIAAPRPGDVAASFADVQKAQERLGWRAKRDLRDACADAWKWQLANPRGYNVSSNP